MEASESDEEHTLQEYGIARALPVDGQEPNWDLEEPDSAEEYLRRVRCVLVGCGAHRAQPSLRQLLRNKVLCGAIAFRKSRCLVSCRHEARNLPDVVQSDIDPRQFDPMRSASAPLNAVQDDEATMCSPEALQSPEWMAAFLSMFERLRVQTVRCVCKGGERWGRAKSGQISRSCCANARMHLSS